MTKIACPVPGAHDAGCVCNGTRELRVSPVGSLCSTCGDPDTQKNLGFVSRSGSQVIGTPCTTCGTVGDPGEYQRRAETVSAPGAEAVALDPPKAPSFTGAADVAARAQPFPEPPPASTRTRELRVVCYRKPGRDPRYSIVHFETDAGELVERSYDDPDFAGSFEAAQLAAIVVGIAAALEKPLVEQLAHNAFRETDVPAHTVFAG